MTNELVPARFVQFGTHFVDLTRVVAVSRYDFDQFKQDWLARLVFDGGGELRTEVYLQDALALLEGREPKR